jgi:hypothetical protein
MPNFACCLANMHQGWPKFVESMWMATNDNGVIAVAYGPSVLKVRVGRGSEVTIKEETNYPFNVEIMFKLITSSKVKFPVCLRIPGWAEKVKISYRNKSVEGQGGETVRLVEKWKDGDEIIMNIPLKLRSESRYNNSVSILRGPLYFALRIEKEYKKVKINYDNFRYKGSVDWEIYPKSDWNYGLMIDRENLMSANQVIENPIGRYPFADKDDMIWSEDSAKYIKWEMDAAVIIKTRGMKIKGWTMQNNSAGNPPFSPVKPEGDPEALILVPYGCTRLRITEFPVMDLTFMTEIARPDL